MTLLWCSGQEIPQSSSLQGTLQSSSLQGTPQSSSLQGTPQSSSSLQGTPQSSSSLQGTPQSISSLQGTPQSSSLQGTPQSGNGNVTPHQQGLPDVPSFVTACQMEVVVQSPPAGLSQAELTAIYKSSCSRRNFSACLVSHLFDEEIRKCSNVAGKSGKEPLNPIVMDYVKSTVFQFYPLESAESLKKAWSLCVISIDSLNRHLNKLEK